MTLLTRFLVAGQMSDWGSQLSYLVGLARVENWVDGVDGTSRLDVGRPVVMDDLL